jgi:hypothetical protein
MKVMKDTQMLWLASEKSDVPAFVRRIPLTPYVQYLRAHQGRLPALELVVESIRFNRDQTRVRFVLVDVANATSGAMCAVPVEAEYARFEDHIRHAQSLAAAPFC